MVKKFFESFVSKLKEASSPEKQSSNKEEVESLKQILDELDHMDPEQARYLASFAFILFRVAYVDRHVSDEESQAILTILQKWGDLNESQALLVAQIAKSQNVLFGGTDNYIVTREFKEMSTPEQRGHLLDCLFAVAASDDSISSLESDTIRMITKELGLSHEEFIAARQQFRDKIEALK